MPVKQKGSPKGVLIGLLIIPVVLFGTCICVAVVARKDDSPRERRARGEREQTPKGKGSYLELLKQNTKENAKARRECEDQWTKKDYPQPAVVDIVEADRQRHRDWVDRCIQDQYKLNRQRQGGSFSP